LAGFCRSANLADEKMPAFCESTKSAESTDTATSFLLAFSMNASRILLAADDLRRGVALG
jgi:hypothetical protein